MSSGLALSSQIGKLLKKSGKTLSIAESCTGGLLGHCLTSVPGSSKYFVGGIIAYADRIKNKKLGVSESLLSKSGAVSEVVAKTMAKNIRKIFKTDYGLAITGIAGPGGGSTQKPVGLVYIAVSNPKKIVCKKFHFTGSRNTIKSRSVHEALKLLRLQLN